MPWLHGPEKIDPIQSNFESEMRFVFDVVSVPQGQSGGGATTGRRSSQLSMLAHMSLCRISGVCMRDSFCWKAVRAWFRAVVRAGHEHVRT